MPKIDDEGGFADFMEKQGDTVHPMSLNLQDGRRVDTFGMTLRDWFAGHALSAMGTLSPLILTDRTKREVVQRQRAEWAYEQADAMIRERNK